MLEIINSLSSNAIQMIAIYIFGLLTLKDKTNKTNKPLYNVVTILVSTIINTFIFFWLDGSIKSIVYCASLMMTFKLLFNVSYGKALMTAIIFIILLIIPDLLIMGITTLIFNMSKEYVHNYFAGSIIGNVLVNTIMLVLIYVLRKSLRKIINYRLSSSKKIILVSSMTLISLAIFFYTLINNFRINSNVWGYLIVIITLIVILFYLFKQKIDNDAISKKYDDLLNIMKNYEKDIEEQRTMIHETRNELMTIKCKINDKEREATIIKYIDSILGDKVSSNMSKYSKFMYLPSNGIKGFFYYKFMEAEKRNITVSVNISKKIENSFLADLETKDFKDLVRMIGVYLDNAIEASSESKDRKLGIEIYLIKDDIDIIISNTYDNEIRMDKMGIEKFTTKGKNNGNGLLLVRHNLHNNSIFEANKEIIKNLYVQ